MSSAHSPKKYQSILILICCISFLSIACLLITPESSQQGQNTPYALDEGNPTKTPLETRSADQSKEPFGTKRTSEHANFQAGTYLVRQDIEPGLYRGVGGNDLFSSCYWERRDSAGKVLSNDNSEGQFYIEIQPTDSSLLTDCEIQAVNPSLETALDFPEEISKGMYLVGIDIKPGSYSGKTGSGLLEACYWARLKDAANTCESIIDNDNSHGEFFIEIKATDFAFYTSCSLSFENEK